MPTLDELQEAIRQIENLPSSYDNCVRLVVFYTLMDKLTNNEEKPVKRQISALEGDSEFIKLFNETDLDYSIRQIDELVECVRITCPAMYDSFIQRFKIREA